MPRGILGILTILSGGTESGVLGDDKLQFAEGGLMISAPAALTGTVTIKVDANQSGTGFVTLQSGGADVTISAGKALTLFPVIWARMKLVSSGAEGADRVFTISAKDR